ncbi:MAG: response regulator [Microcoleaceae cyanobacterium MO_207.B10]|nr:response regulator [Microcoleaceae cyanobacterium MO_207.B10]
MSASTIAYTKLANTLSIVSQKQVTGKLVLAHGNQEWQLYFLFGHLLYASGGRHPTRRWYRAISQHCPELKFEVNQLTSNQLWEYKFLQKSIAENQVNLAQAKAVLRDVAEEVFFAIISQPGLTRTWHPQKHSTSQTSLSLLLSRLEIKQVLGSAKRIWKYLKEVGLWHINPDTAPVIKDSSKLLNQGSSESFIGVNELLNGDRTIWDIALKRKVSLVSIISNLYKFETRKLIDFRQVEDWLSPPERLRLVSEAKRSYKATIACIDDSCIVGNLLEKILQPLGYKILNIQDPIKGLALLEEQKTALIFLDLVMPKVSGYTICDFLRKTSTFKDTPIVFLTSKDGIIDRTRAKLTGANGYLSKSDCPEKVVEIVEKYLNVEKPKASPMKFLDERFSFSFVPVGN